MREGWKCPGCGRCWAPQVISCSECEKVAAHVAPAYPNPPPIPTRPQSPTTGTPLPPIYPAICSGVSMPNDPTNIFVWG